MSEAYEVVMCVHSHKEANDIAEAINNLTIYGATVRKVNPDAHPE